jgi:A/G-specific adenine glycosylase
LNVRVRAASRLASQLVAWFRANKRDLPWRRTRDAYAIWVSEIMLQQTQVKTVIPYWERWMRELPTIAALAKAKPDRVLKLWEGLGYYSRARNLQKATQLIVETHRGVFPRKFEHILELPGIGRYTAGAIGSIAFGLPTPIVDGNVARVLARYLGIRGDPKSRETNSTLWQAAERLVQAAQNFNACGELNEALMELGATICLPGQPRCGECPIRARCFAWKNGKTGELPEMAPRAATTRRVFRAALVRERKGVWMRKRPAGIVNAGFWELPNVEVAGESPEESLTALFGEKKLSINRLCDVKHSITRFRMVLEVFEVFSAAPLDCKLLFCNDLKRSPIVNSHRRVLNRMGIIDGPKERVAKDLMEKFQSCATLHYQM